MPCPDENVLLDFVEDQLKGEAAARVRKHLDGCHTCQAIVDGAVCATTQVAFEPLLQNLAPQAGLIGQQVGEYRIEEFIGSGGMGFVYRGVHPLIGKTVAVKVLRPELAADPEQYRLMLREAQAMSQIESRRIVEVFAFGQLPDGRHYMVMEFLRGASLSSTLKAGGKLTLPHVLDLSLAIVDALEPAHHAGIVHRDLKPSNLHVVDAPGQPPLVKLLDFGLAKRTSDREVTEMLRGTPAYMSPEQALSTRVDGRSDLYSLGVIIFEVATGQRPFKGRSLLEYLELHVETQPPSPRSVRPEISPALSALILELLAKDPDQRPATCAEVRKRLLAVRRSSGKGSRGLAAVAVSLVAACAVAAAVWWPRPQPVPVVEVVAAPEVIVPPPAVIEEPPAAERIEPVAPPPEVRVKKTKPTPTTLTRLQQRSAMLKLEVLRTTPRGEEPDPIALMLLERSTRELTAAKSEAELKRIENVLREVEQKYVHRQ